MKKIALGALLAGLLVACGGDKKSNPDVLIVTNPDAPSSTTCNLFTQTGCATGEKCTWIRIAASTTQQLGKIGCSPSATSTVAVGGDCKWGAAGDTTGFDNCMPGSLCLASSETDQATGKCEAICDPSTIPGSGATGACATNYACGFWSNFFENPGDTGAPAAGLCDPSCDPLTQKRDTDGAANCGGGLDANQQPKDGCYGGWFGTNNVPSQFTCSGNRNPTNTADVIAYETARGTYYLNSCAAGYVPLYVTDSAHRDAMHVMCTAFCEPVATSKESHPSPAGTKNNADWVGGDCISAGHTAPVECHFWWPEEFDPTTGAVGSMSKWSNGLGSCEEYTRYVYDATAYFKNGANNPYTGAPATTMDPVPSCTVLSSTAFLFDTNTADNVNDAMFWGCQPEPTAFAGKQLHWKRPEIRLAPQYANTAAN